MRIRVLQPVTVVVDLQSGDELIMTRPPESIQSLLNARRMDGEPVLEVVDDEERADAPVTTPERAVGRRVQRAAAVP